MRKKMMLAGCCVAALLLSAGCQGSSEKAQETPKAVETPKATVTQKATATPKATGTPKAVGAEGIPSEDPADAPVQIQGEEENMPEQDQPETETYPGTTEIYPETAEDFTGSQAEGVYEEDMMQCPYCGQWFSTLPDGDLWNPYDRHVLEERDSAQSEQETEETEEMVQCPDCGNWYESGNVFRNHICEGR